MGKQGDGRKIVVQNRRAKFDYFIHQTLETGVVLQGTEVKALRAGQASLGEAYVSPENAELFLINAFIPEYKQGGYTNHEPRRRRKLLARGREIRKLSGLVTRKGMTLIPVSLYLNPRGMIKLELGVAEGKKTQDKREAIKERDWKRQKAVLLKQSR
ncbi:MAG: SsrA-binding protein SmpB [Alphaproteobacteria bacterium]